MQTEQITQRLCMSNGIAPQTLSNGRLSSDYVDMQQSRRAIFVLNLGALAAGSINWYLQEDSVTSFSNSSNDTAGSFSGSAGSNVSATGLGSDNKVYTIEVNASQLSAGKRYVRLQIKNTVAVNSNVSVVAFGDEGEHKPNNFNQGPNVSTQSVVA